MFVGNDKLSKFDKELSLKIMQEVKEKRLWVG
jgi:hypothetical protein